MPTFKQRRGTAAALAAANETPAAGQIIFEIDTNRIKVGNGTTAYNALPYLNTTIAAIPGLQAALDSKATPADVTAAVASILDAAPATLDTLNELAAAIGDDPSFVTSITTALDTKAPINNPAFTGTVSGVTKAMVGLGNADNTSDANKPVSTAQAAADAAVQAHAIQRTNHTGTQPSSTISDFTAAASAAAPVQSVAGRSGAVVLTKSDVGLSNVDNTSDANKPISTAVQAALDGKQAAGSYAAAVHTHVIANVTGLQAALDSKATPADVSTAVANLVNAAPASLDTLKELADALGNDASFAATVTNNLATKVNNTDSRLTDAREWIASTVTQSEAETGTGTDRRAFTPQRVFQAIAAWWSASSAKTKLDGIQSGATANSTDAQLRDRSTHTGTQAISTVSGLQSALDSKQAAGSYATQAAVDDLNNRVFTVESEVAGIESALTTQYVQTNDPRLTLSPATSSTLGGVKIGSGVNVAVDGTISVTPGSYTLPAATATVLGGVKIGAGVSVTGDGTISVSTNYATLSGGVVPIAQLPTGTTSTTVALGNHTHAQLHDRIHAITSTSDHTATAWRTFYSNASGQVIELPLGASGTVLQSSGASAAPAFAAIQPGTRTCAVRTALDNQPPATAFATLDTRNSIAVLDFDDNLDESAVFVGVIPHNINLGSGISIRIHYMATTATSGSPVWNCGIRRCSAGGLDTDGFVSAGDSVGTAVSASNGTASSHTYFFGGSNIDGLTPGDIFRLRVTRKGTSVSDTVAGDIELIAVEIRSEA